MAVGGASHPGLAANTPLPRPRSRPGAARSLPPPSPLVAAAPKEVCMRHADMDGTRLASTTRPSAARPGELVSEQKARPTARADRRGRAAERGVWSPWTTLAYCWRSRTLLGVGAWLAVSPLVLGTTGDRHSTESALLTGVLLMGTAFWALLTRKPASPPRLQPVAGALAAGSPVAVVLPVGRGLPELACRGTGRCGALGLGAVDRLADPATGGPGRLGLRSSSTSGATDVSNGDSPPTSIPCSRPETTVGGPR